MDLDELEVEEKLSGRWAVDIPDTALMNWTEWDNLAAELTMTELSMYGIVWVNESHTMSGKKARGEYYPRYRRQVGEALAHLTALARVRGPGPLTVADWEKHDRQLFGKSMWYERRQLNEKGEGR